MSLEVELLHRVEALEQRIDGHCADHPLDAHDHLMDEDEHVAHHARLDAPKEKRAGERRVGSERRTSTDKYEGEERRSA